MIKARLHLLFLCLCWTFSACGTDPGSAAQKLLEQACEEQSQGYLKVVNFAKKDAVSEERNGVDYYLITYEMEVEGVKDGGFADICESHGKYGAVMSFRVTGDYNKGDCHVFPVEKGHRYQVEGLFNQNIKSMTLAKHENGWVLEQFGR